MVLCCIVVFTSLSHAVTGWVWFSGLPAHEDEGQD